LPEFVNPFSVTVPERMLTRQELIRAIRLTLRRGGGDLSLHGARRRDRRSPRKRVLMDVANEEREHVGEFQRLLGILTGDEREWMSHGINEVNEMAAEVEKDTPKGRR